MIYIPRIRGASLTHFSIFFLRRAPPLLPLKKEMPHPLVHLPHRLPLFLSPFLYFQSFRPSFLASLSLYLSRNSSKSFSCVTRFRERKLSCLANHARPPPSPPPLLFPPFLSSFVHRGYALRHVQTQKFGANFVQA